jgi:hypothetical protein
MRARDTASFELSLREFAISQHALNHVPPLHRILRPCGVNLVKQMQLRCGEFTRHLANVAEYMSGGRTK